MGRTYVVAVSGGVDSVALLDMLSQTDHDLVVAHFDHGIRPDSKDDARFVRELADSYGAKFVLGRARLGKRASEQLARDRRYAFLREVAQAHEGRIVTAHHGDDVVETIIVNINRGTGWRGLAVMGATDIARPLKAMSKAELKAYARSRGLRWHEDPTNKDHRYTRNKIRHSVMPMIAPAERDELVRFHALQQGLKRAIDDEATGIADALRRVEDDTVRYPRHFFIMADESSASEVLRACLKRETGKTLTRPALHRLLCGIKVGRAGTTLDAGGSVAVRLTDDEFGF